MSTTPIVKICCIASHEEAMLATDAGASALGLVSAMPSGPGVIDETLIADIASRVTRPTKTFLLTAQVTAQAIASQHHRCRTTTLQLVDRVTSRELILLRHKLPDVELVQVIHVRDADAITEAKAIAPLVDAILLDSGNQSLAIKQLGGTGRTHDWSISRRIRDVIDKPLYLAGGLNPENVQAAIDAVQPYGVDVCSGLRVGGKLDARKVKAFFSAIL
jgi:phosphoribosylanthranilate isomerase